MTQFGGTFADGPIAKDSLAYAILFNISDSVTASDAVTYAFIPGSGGITDLATASSQLVTQLVYHLSPIENTTASDKIVVSTVVSPSETAYAHDAINLMAGARFADRARASDAISLTATLSFDLVEKSYARDGINFQKAVSSAGSATAHDAIQINYIANVSLIERVSASDVIAPWMVYSVVLKDTTDADDVAVPNFVYSMNLIEYVYASEFASPDDSVTTWAINTRTNAVSQYSNFAFNSFASIGRKYLAADQSGLYELNGARDLEVNVVGKIEGGYFEPADGKLAGFKGVYIAVAGQGNGAGATWMLKLEAGDGREYLYQRVSNPTLMVTKFDIGKGLRATYFAWKLIAIDGQDFDIDSITFIPMASGRRI